MVTRQPSDEVRRLDLPAALTAPSKAREFARAALRAWLVPPDEVQIIEIVVSELVTNAARASSTLDRTPGLSADDLGVGRAGGENISLILRLLPGEVVVEVADNIPASPISTNVGPDAETGRGLMIMDALSKAWGHKPAQSGGKIVYAVLGITR